MQGGSGTNDGVRAKVKSGFYQSRRWYHPLALARRLIFIAPQPEPVKP